MKEVLTLEKIKEKLSGKKEIWEVSPRGEIKPKTIFLKEKENGTRTL